MDIKVLYEYLIWFNENKKSLEEGLRTEQANRKAAEEKAAKEAKIGEELKKQVQEKLATTKEKNQKLLDLHCKIGSYERKLADAAIKANQVP